MNRYSISFLVLTFFLVSQSYSQSQNEQITSGQVKYHNGATYEVSLKNNIKELEELKYSITSKMNSVDEGSDEYNKKKVALNEVNALLEKKRARLAKITEK